MNSNELREKYIKFFVDREHVHIPSAPLVPKEDPTTLFISAGMQPLVPYLLGQEHPAGRRLVNWQQCLRTDDIDEVGDAAHNTFFEMLGNWSLGDPASPDGIGQGGYWKEEAISWSFEFLTKELSIPLTKLAVTVFAGDKDAPQDDESAAVWKRLGIHQERIFALGKKDNWWGPVGPTGPCGPDTEMFVWTGDGEPVGSPGKDNRWVEIWNNVFMEYNKTAQGKFEPLEQKNVDTGMGLERTSMVLQRKSSVFEVDTFVPIVQLIKQLSKKDYSSENERSIRIIADHARAATFVLAEGVVPSNKERGYILRRLIRRAVRHVRLLGLVEGSLTKTADSVVTVYKNTYPELEKVAGFIKKELEEEEERFKECLAHGLKEIEKIHSIDGKVAFFLYESYGFPLELTEEIAREKGQEVDKKLFEQEFKRHKQLSRTASKGRFKGGLATTGEQETKYHTATHLLHQALRTILGEHVVQHGSNITSERLRFDFSHPTKLTKEEVRKVENLVNEQVDKNLNVSRETIGKDEALASGAIGAFGERYGEQVKVYSIGNFSKEICGGPHVQNTGKIGHVKITKEESSGAGIRRIYAMV